MRNLLIGLFLGSALTAGVSVSAGGIKGPELKGNSGPLNYVVIQGPEVVCVNPWVNMSEKTIECYPAPPDGPADKIIIERNIAE